jgi:hypothetical protein
MASRLDAIQIAVPRAVTDAAQQHAAQRQPVIAQEQATKTVREEQRAREQRPEALEGRDGREVRNDLTPEVREREARRRAPRRNLLPGNGTAAPPPAQSVEDTHPDGKGLRVDVRL